MHLQTMVGGPHVMAGDLAIGRVEKRYTSQEEQTNVCGIRWGLLVAIKNAPTEYLCLCQGTIPHLQFPLQGMLQAMLLQHRLRWPWTSSTSRTSRCLATELFGQSNVLSLRRYYRSAQCLEQEGEAERGGEGG